MIGIKLTDTKEFLELPPDTKVTLRLENPLLADTERISPGSFSMPFNIPGGKVSPGNAAKLNLPQVLENTRQFEVINAGLFYKGVPYKSGTLQASEATGDDITSNFLFGLSQINPEFKSAKLRDVISENFVIDNTAINKKIYLKRITGTDYKVKINGVDYEEVDATNLRDAVNTDAAASLDSGRDVPYATLIVAGTSPSGEIAAPFLEIKLVKYTTGSGYQDSSDPLQELSVGSNEAEADYDIEPFDLDAYYDGFDTFMSGYLTGSPYPDNKLRFPIRYNSTPFDETIKRTDYVNHNDHVPNPLRNVATIFQVRNMNSLQPFVLLKHVLDKIADYFGFSYEGDFYEDAGLASILLDNTTALDVPQLFVRNVKFIFWRRSFNINELVPDWTVVNFLSALISRYNIGVYVNEITKKVRLVKREPIAQSYAYTDITSISSPLKGNKDERITGFALKVPAEKTDTFSVEESLTVGTPQQTIEMKVGRLHQTKYFNYGYGDMSGPIVAQKFNSAFGLRVFYYAGISGANSKCDINPPGDPWDLTSLYNTSWKYWLHFQMKRRIIKLKVSWPFRILRMFDWEKKVRYDRNNYLVKSISVTLENDRVSDSDVEMIKF